MPRGIYRKWASKEVKAWQNRQAPSMGVASLRLMSGITDGSVGSRVGGREVTHHSELGTIRD